MKAQFKILFLDHDDTSVNSTPTIHYPAHVEMMKTMRPDSKIVGINEWYAKNFDPGIMSFLKDEVNYHPQRRWLSLGL